MRARLRSHLRDLLDSLWFTPTLIASLYVVLALVLLRADAALGLETQGRDEWAVGGADGARGVLFVIAGTSLSVLSVVFSLTVVVLQIASAQFTPRVMRNLTGDTGTQVVLGVFVSRSVQVAVIIKRVTEETQELLDEPLAGETGADHRPDETPWDSSDDGNVVMATDAGYLQAIDAAALLQAAQARPLTIHTQAHVGSFLLAGAPLATVWPSGRLTLEQTEAIRAAFVLGPERTRQQDVELGIRQLADIAVRALSPAVNDPPTATLCIDRLGQLLVQVARQNEAELLVGAAGGQVLLRRPTFARLCDVAFTQIRHYGAGDAVVAAHVMKTLREVATREPVVQQEPLRQQAMALLAEASRTLIVTDDIHRLERAAAWVHDEIQVR